MRRRSVIRNPAPMNPIRRYRNITVRRIVLDAYQFLRAQRPVLGVFGRQFRRSSKYVEIDVTYKCNLKCLNCNRSCTQLPSDEEIAIERVANFVKQSADSGARWERIRILGGEPTLHGGIFDIVGLLRDYRRAFNPGVRIVLCTNAFGRQVQEVLAAMPGDIEIKSAIKTSRNTLFRPFNRAPVDTPYHRFSDFACGCRILSECGLGLTPSGYYACAIAGGIDRVFGFAIGRETLPDPMDAMEDQLTVFCRLCGHFGWAWPVKKEVMSATWQAAYQKLKKNSK
jgi:hypothetical protein